MNDKVRGSGSSLHSTGLLQFTEPGNTMGIHSNDKERTCCAAALSYLCVLSKATRPISAAFGSRSAEATCSGSSEVGPESSCVSERLDSTFRNSNRAGPAASAAVDRRACVTLQGSSQPSEQSASKRGRRYEKGARRTARFREQRRASACRSSLLARCSATLASSTHSFPLSHWWDAFQVDTYASASNPFHTPSAIRA